MTRSSFIRAGAFLTLAWVLWCALWAVVTPAFRTPDEPIHLNSVLRMERTGQWPDPGSAFVDQSVLDAAVEAGLIPEGKDSLTAADRTALDGNRFTELRNRTFYQDLDPVTERMTPSYSGELSELADQMTQHPPMYYAIAGAAMRVTGASSWAWDGQVLFLRLLNVLIAAPIMPCLLYTVRRADASRSGALLAGSFLFGMPQLAFVASGAGNDALTFTAGALLAAAGARAMFGRGSWADAGLVAAALGLGLWCKGTFLPLGLMVVLFFVANASIGSWRSRLWRGLGAGLGGLAIGGWWWLRNLLHFGTLQPEGMIRESERNGTMVGYFLRVSVDAIVRSFWGRLGWLEWDVWGVVVLSLTILSLLGLVLALRDREMRWRYAVLASGPFLIGLMVMYGAWSTYSQTAIISGVQGRYLLPGVVGFLAVVGVPLWKRRGGRWASSRSALAVSYLPIAFGALTLTGWSFACYRSVERWSLASGIPVPVLVASACVVVLALLAAPILVWLAGRESDVLPAESL